MLMYALCVMLTEEEDIFVSHHTQCGFTISLETIKFIDQKLCQTYLVSGSWYF